MIIDASLGRANCCGYPCGMQQQPCPPPQPTPPQIFPPQPPQPAMPNTLQLQLATAQTALANGAVVPLSTIVRQTGSDLSFSAANSAFTVNKTGVYTINWTVLVQTSGGGTADPVIALQSLDGQTVLGYTGTLNADMTNGAQLTGHTVALLPAGSSWVLVNATGEAIDIPVAGTAPAAFAASMTVVEVAAPASHQQSCQMQSHQQSCQIRPF